MLLGTSPVDIRVQGTKYLFNKNLDFVELFPARHNSSQLGFALT